MIERLLWYGVLLLFCGYFGDRGDGGASVALMWNEHVENRVITYLHQLSLG